MADNKENQNTGSNTNNLADKPEVPTQPKDVPIDLLTKKAKEEKAEFGSAGHDDINKNLGSFGNTQVQPEPSTPEVKLDVDAKVVEKAAAEKLNFERFTKEYIIEQENLSNEPKIDKKKIEQKIRRLNDMYLEDKCSKEYFDSHYKELKEQLEFEEPKIEEFKRIIEGRPMDIYNQLTIAEKNQFWRLLIKSIKLIDKEYVVEWL